MDNTHATKYLGKFWRFIFWMFIINALINLTLYPVFLGIFKATGAYIHSWGIDNELHAILNAGLILSYALFAIAIILYVIEAVEACELTKMNFLPLPKRLFGEYSFPLALFFNAGLFFMVVFTIKKSLASGLAQFTVTGALPVG